jgi:hypothetical protein
MTASAARQPTIHGLSSEPEDWFEVYYDGISGMVRSGRSYGLHSLNYRPLHVRPLPQRLLGVLSRTELKETARSRERAPHYPATALPYAYLPWAREARELEETFLQLSAEWREKRPPSSFVEDLVLHPAYQRIIGLGKVVVPLILRELAQQPDHWFWALYCITGEDPVDASDAGNLSRMARAWVEWGRKRGLCR